MENISEIVTLIPQKVWGFGSSRLHSSKYEKVSILGGFIVGRDEPDLKNLIKQRTFYKNPIIS